MPRTVEQFPRFFCVTATCRIGIIGVALSMPTICSLDNSSTDRIREPTNGSRYNDYALCSRYNSSPLEKVPGTTNKPDDGFLSIIDQVEDEKVDIVLMLKMGNAMGGVLT